jgi:hypothetical protein
MPTQHPDMPKVPRPAGTYLEVLLSSHVPRRDEPHQETLTASGAGCGRKERRLGGEPALSRAQTCQQLGIPLGRLDAELDPDEPGEPAPLEVDPMLPEPVEPDPVEPAPMLLEPVEPAAEPDAPAPL